MFQQCVACNLTIPNSHQTNGSCVCGHVITEKKLIGGKRFSEYRAELYSRLQCKKQRGLIRENVQSREESRVFESTSLELYSLEISSRELPEVKKFQRPSCLRVRTKETLERSKPVRRQTNQPQVLKPKQDITDAVLPPLLLRFPQALAEINRRLVSQNLLWYTLDRDTGIVTDR